jgi:glucose/arabinose dehydrogenase
MQTRSLALGILCSALAACGGGGGGTTKAPKLVLETAFGGIQFAAPVKLVQHPEVDDRWYVAEQGGKIWTFLASNPAGTKTMVLDVVADDSVVLGSGDEQGLLGLALDPDFGNGGELYIVYTDNAAADVVLARYESDDDDGPFERTEDAIVLAIPHPNDNHNGGDINFGPDDFLYYSMGDGGSSDDPDDNGQDTGALLGKILRLDVRGTPAPGEAYDVPVTNPFQTSGRPFCDANGVSPAAQPCPEVYAYGLRNPWRMNFDPETEELWVGDVGQSQREEIDLVLIGRNYGWDCREGDLDHATAFDCTGLVFEAPRAAHSRTLAKAITGGAVYRGTLVPDLFGFYVYGDFNEQNFFAFDVDTAAVPEQLDVEKKHVSAFGQGRDGEVYVVTYDAPSIYRFALPPPPP